MKLHPLLNVVQDEIRKLSDKNDALEYHDSQFIKGISSMHLLLPCKRSLLYQLEHIKLALQHICDESADDDHIIRHMLNLLSHFQHALPGHFSNPVKVGKSTIIFDPELSKKRVKGPRKYK